MLPLAAAVSSRDRDVVVWLLSLGADPNGDHVMYYCACDSTTDIMQLLIDAGGDVNGTLIGAVDQYDADNVRVLAAQPIVDAAVKYGGATTGQRARSRSSRAGVAAIAEEVSSVCVCFKTRFVRSVAHFVFMLLWSADGEASGTGKPAASARQYWCVMKRHP